MAHHDQQENRALSDEERASIRLHMLANQGRYYEEKRASEKLLAAMDAMEAAWARGDAGYIWKAKNDLLEALEADRRLNQAHEAARRRAIEADPVYAALLEYGRRLNAEAAGS
jgi:exoribonuclease R